MDEKKAVVLLREAGFDSAQIEALIEAFALVGHEHDAGDIITDEKSGETLDEVLDELTEESEEEAEEVED